MDDLVHFADYLEHPQGPPPRVMDVPAEMVFKLAIGMEDPAEIAKQFNYSQDEFAALCAWEPFRVQVDATKAKLQQEGFNFRLQNQFFAEETGKKLFVRVSSPDTTIPQLLDAYRTFSKLANLEPKDEKTETAAGPAFSININLSGRKTETITVEPDGA